MPVVMGSAGHIDHGKTSLVRALTGIDCDRLEEEKRRGITIELGFAYLTLPMEQGCGKLSIIDVPGHERFVKNMVSGASGIDFVTLVIAADEGVMPQTREHLEICGLLGIKRGLVALTKTDMVDAEWLALVLEEIKEFLKGTFLEEAPVFPVSSQTGEGIDALREAIFALAASFSPERSGDLPRLPIDRVFTMRGHGTVVTGTLVSGSLSVGDDVILFPSGRASKARGLQSHGVSVDKAQAGYRTAVNLPGLEVDDIHKGDVLTRPGNLREASSWLVIAECLASSPHALKNRAVAHFHHGAREVQAKLIFFDREKLQPGDSALCRVRFEEPMVGVFGDRSVLRSFSPLRTVGGCRVLVPLDFELRKKDPAYARKLEILGELARKSGAGNLSAEEAVLLQLELHGASLVDFASLRVAANLESSLLDKTLQLLGSRRQVYVVDKEERRCLGAEAAEALCASCLEWMADFHRREPMRPGPGRSEIGSGWGKKHPPKLVHFILERLVKQGDLALDGEAIRLSGHSVAMAGSAARLRDSLLGAYVRSWLAPPNIRELLEELGSSSKEAAPVLRLLVDSGEIVKVTEDIYYARAAMDDVLARVAAWFEKHDNLDVTGIKELTGLSRKYLIALLEYFDRAKITVRVGDKRLLRKQISA